MMPIVWIIVSFVGMEFFTGWFHKNVMHGWLWVLHESHHKPPRSFFQKNDWFVLFFMTTSISLILIGAPDGIALWMGIGVALYGMSYFFVHDYLIHRRVGDPPKPVRAYARAVHRAHMAHHKHVTNATGEAFGLLWVPMKYWKREDGRDV